MGRATGVTHADGCANERGINGTDLVRIDRATYEACIDPYDYRPKSN
jgi:hypothetical protein